PAAVHSPRTISLAQPGVISGGVLGTAAAHRAAAARPPDLDPSTSRRRTCSRPWLRRVSPRTRPPTRPARERTRGHAPPARDRLGAGPQPPREPRGAPASGRSTVQGAAGEIRSPRGGIGRLPADLVQA